VLVVFWYWLTQVGLEEGPKSTYDAVCWSVDCVNLVIISECTHHLVISKRILWVR